jgi:hypothetical protein
MTERRPIHSNGKFAWYRLVVFGRGILAPGDATFEIVEDGKPLDRQSSV